MAMEYPDERNFIPKALISLREEIDHIDHQILKLLCKRNAVVERIAGVKRTAQVGIRDYKRERELLEDRGSLGEASGLQREVIESLFRVILWASRDCQASLGVEIPLSQATKSISIIGGHGEMGKLFCEFFRDFGHDVLIADIDTKQTNCEVASQADVVVIAVPIEDTEGVIEELSPHCSNDTLLMDITSTKTKPMASMLKSFQGSVIGTHPLFGPSIHSLQGQRIAVVCGRDTEHWLSWLCAMFRARGVSVLETTAQEHDQAMGIVQVLTHQTTEVLGRTIQQLGVDVQRTLAFTSPIYLMELVMAARHFAQSADLYASIQMHNPETKRVLDALHDAGDELRQLILQGNRDGFNGMFDEVHSHFGEFSEQALEQSNFLIDRLVERG